MLVAPMGGNGAKPLPEGQWVPGSVLFNAPGPESPRSLSMTRQVATLTLADARQLIQAGEQKAAELKIPYNIAVVDAGGALIAHVRMDGAWLGSINISINKAFTARAFDMSTDDLSRAAQ